MTEASLNQETPEPAARQPLIERVREALIGRYDPEREIGRGGMAVVYLAKSSAGCWVALKVLPPERAYIDGMASRFIAECNAIERLTHPNIVSVLDRGHTGDLLWFTMEYVEGQPLSKLVQIGTVDPIRVARLIAQAAAALSHAHRHGVIHRDIKPSNLLVRRSTDELIVMDFGIAKTMGDHTLTETGTAVGTAQYMSPEQLTGRDHVGPATDQYSLGVVAYEMLAGARPFEVDSVSALAVAQTSRPVPPLAGRAKRCPVDLACLVERMLMQRPRWRWPDLDVVAEAAAEIGATGSAPSLRGIPGHTESQRWRMVAMIAAVGVLAVGGWQGYLRFIGDSPAPIPLSSTDSLSSTDGQGAKVAPAAPPQYNEPVSDKPVSSDTNPTDQLAAAAIPPKGQQPRRFITPSGRESAGRPAPVMADLGEPQPAPTSGTLSLTTREPGTAVYLNDERAPLILEADRATSRSLPIGVVKLKVATSRPECTGFETTDTIVGGQTRRRQLNARCPNP